jgi:DnaJ-class molecular chaperone
MTQTPPIGTPASGEPAAPQTAENTCRSCAGSGRVNDRPCPDCDGRGTLPVTVGDA